MPTRTTIEAASARVGEAATRRIVVNGEAVTVAATTLEALLAEIGFGGGKVATAINGDFVPAARRGATVLADGDRIEIVSPRQGG